MPDSYNRKQLVFTHGQMVQVLDEMVRKNFSEWSQNLDGRYLKRLEQPLMVRCKDKTTKLDINFDKWVTQTQLTHKRHKAFTLKYTFTQGLTLYTDICVLVRHTKRYAVETKQFHTNRKTQVHIYVTHTRVHLFAIYFMLFMCSLFQQPIEPVF